MAVAVCANDIVDSIGKKNYKDSIIFYKAIVIDTLEAEKLFSEKKIGLMEAYQNGEARLQRCKELMGMPGKKVKEKRDLELLHSAYERYLENNPEIVRSVKKSVFIPIPFAGVVDVGVSKSLDKNVKKGKLSAEVMNFLSCYYYYLSDSLQKVHDKIEQGWSTWVRENELKYKEINISTKNPYYIGYNYYKPGTLDMLEQEQLLKGWEFLRSYNRTQKHDSYPHDVKYYVYSEAPQYRVLYGDEGIKDVYDENGTLVYVPSLTREENSAELNDIKRIVYLRDYQNNKYGIRSQSAHTQEYLNLVLGQENGFEKAKGAVMGTLYGAAFASMIATSMLSPFESYKLQNRAKQVVVEEALKYKDTDGENFIEQLRKDHNSDFGYVYIIERLSNVSFKVLYINKKFKPSYVAIISYSTGKEPYTKKFSIELTDNMPANIPPVHAVTVPLVLPN